MTYPNFVDHLVFRVAEVARSERFYTALLGHPAQRTEGSITYQVGDTLLFFTRSDEYQAGSYEKEKIGLNHLAFGVRTLEELQAMHRDRPNRVLRVILTGGWFCAPAEKFGLFIAVLLRDIKET